MGGCRRSWPNVQRLHHRPAKRLALGMLPSGQVLQNVRVGETIEDRKGAAITMTIASLLQKQKPGRKVHGIAAALLPYAADGRVAVEDFQRHLRTTDRAGLMNAVNMDTGNVNYLDEAERRDVLRWTTEALGKDVPFVAGAYIEGQTGEVADLYRRQMDAIVGFGGTPILFQTAQLHGKSAKEKAAVY